jgi:4-amino-4-deoxy-L-arabinose transferase-like glycosyltransferase
MKNKLFREITIVLFISLVYFLLRFYHSTSIPVFGDEAIYLRWSQIIKSVDSLRFIPQTDGKQPLFMWMTVIFFKLFSDPLIAGRTLSTLAGYATLLTIYTICRIFINSKVSLTASIIYVLLPFTFFFDRLALPDNLLATFGSLSLLFSLLLAKYPRLDLALILGGVLGLSWLTKSPAIYFIILSIATFLLYHKNNIAKIYLPLVSTILAFIIYNILRLGPQFGQIAIRNRDYIWPLAEILKHPLDPLIPHLKDVIAIFSTHISWPLLIISLISFLILKNSHTKIILIILGWSILPLLSNLIFAKVFTARYILFTIPPLIIFVAAGYTNLNIKIIPKSIILFLLLLPNVITIYQLSTKPFDYKIYATESGYLSSWTSGWGIKETSEYLIERSLHANVIVGTEGYFGTLPDGLQIYGNQVPQLTIFGVGLDISSIPEKLLDARSHGDEVYLLFNNSRLRLSPDKYNNLEIQKSYPKPDGDTLLLLKLK